MPWTPLLHGPEAEAAVATAEEVASALQPAESATLAGGSAGFALLQGYLARVRPGQGHEQASDELLDHAFNVVGSTAMPPSLHEGFVGVAWVEHHLGGDPGEEVDLALLDLVKRRPWQGHFDLVSGLAGLGLYAVDRSVPEVVSQIVARLREKAERLEGGAAWKVEEHLIPAWARGWNPVGNFNLGVAHGAPGVVALLGRAAAAGVRDAEPILADAVAWILSKRRPGARGSDLPGWWLPGEAPTAGRTAWCYGGLGAAAALLVAARSIGNAAWERAAVGLALAAAARPPEETGVVDAGLCHGAAGLGLLFHRIHHATGEGRLAEAALAWYRRALAMREPGRWTGGYGAWDPVKREMGEDSGFLAGAAGVALGLLAAATPVEPAWDRVLAMSGEEERTSAPLD